MPPIFLTGGPRICSGLKGQEEERLAASTLAVHLVLTRPLPPQHRGLSSATWLTFPARWQGHSRLRRAGWPGR